MTKIISNILVQHLNRCRTLKAESLHEAQNNSNDFMNWAKFDFYPRLFHGW